MPYHIPDSLAALIGAAARKTDAGVVKSTGHRTAEIRKAIAGGLAGAVPLFAVDIADMHISQLEAGGLIGAFALGALAVFKVPNAPAASEDDE